MSDSVRELFAPYVEESSYYDSVSDLPAHDLAVWTCEDCDVQVPVVADDPQGYGPVLCPECGSVCEYNGVDR